MIKIFRVVFLFFVIFSVTACSNKNSDATKEQAKENQQNSSLVNETKSSAIVSLSDEAKKYIAVQQISAEGDLPGDMIPARLAFRPQALSAVGSPMTARVVNIDVRPGQQVKAGSVLMTLESTDVAGARSTLTQAQAKFSAAEDALKRQSELTAKGVGVESERFAAEVAFREAKAELKRAQEFVSFIGPGNKDRFQLKAPMAGIVLTVKTTAGAVVSPGGDALIELGDPERLWVVADIPEQELGAWSIGMVVDLAFPARDLQLSAKVEGVGQQIDGNQRRLPVYIAPDKPLDHLTPGMLAEVRLKSVGKGLISLPTSAVLIKEGRNKLVYVERPDGKYEARPIKTGAARAGRVTVTAGLQVGDKVVVQGALFLDGEAEQLL